MNRSFAAFACVACAAVCSAQDAPTIDALVRQLGAESSDARDAAQAKLIELGQAAVPALRKATESEDLEVASRAREALAQIGGQRDPVERPQPERPELPPEMPQIPDMDRMLEELQKDLDQQMPDMGKLFEKLFEELQNPGQGNQGQDPNQGRMRVWTFNNQSGGGFSGVSSRLGLALGSPSAALRAQLGIEDRAGLVVNQVLAGGWAEQHGIQLYDVLVRRDGRALKTMNDLNPLLEQGGKLELYRKAKLESVTIPGAGGNPSEGTTQPRKTPEAQEPKKQGRNF
ncbi:MAG: hypothetical protein R3F62_02165 [Planctomycetota bacterium]